MRRHSPRPAVSDDEQERLLAVLEAQSRRAMGLDAAPPAKRRRIDPSDDESSAMGDDDDAEEWTGFSADDEGGNELSVSQRALRWPVDRAEPLQPKSRPFTSPSRDL